MGEMFGKELRRLRDLTGLSREKLARATVSTGNEGISTSAVEALEEKPTRRPDDRTRVLLGRALAEKDQTLAGVELAEARLTLDERYVGEQQAQANLERVKAALGLPVGDAALAPPGAFGRAAEDSGTSDQGLEQTAR